jgi:hypothetical protein
MIIKIFYRFFYVVYRNVVYLHKIDSRFASMKNKINMGIKLTEVTENEIALVRQLSDGRIVQIALSVEQSKMLQNFLSAISQSSPLILMGEEYDMILKSAVCKKCKTK